MREIYKQDTSQQQIYQSVSLESLTTSLKAASSAPWLVLRSIAMAYLSYATPSLSKFCKEKFALVLPFHTTRLQHYNSVAKHKPGEWKVCCDQKWRQETANRNGCQ